MTVDYNAGERARLMHLVCRPDVQSINKLIQLFRWATTERDILKQYTKKRSCDEIEFAERLAALVAVATEGEPEGELVVEVEAVERLCLKTAVEIAAYRKAKTDCLSYESYKTGYRNNDATLLEKREMKKKPNLGPVMHLIESGAFSSTAKLASLASWAKEPALMKECAGSTNVKGTTYLYQVRALFDQAGQLMAYSPQYVEEMDAVINAFFDGAVTGVLRDSNVGEVPEYRSFLAFLKNTDTNLASEERLKTGGVPTMQQLLGGNNIQPDVGQLGGARGQMLLGGPVERRQTADPHRYSVTDALIVLLQNTPNHEVALLPALADFLQNCSYFDAQALLDRFTKSGWTLPGLEAVDSIPVNQREGVKDTLLRQRCLAGAASQSPLVVEAAEVISKMVTSPVGVSMRPSTDKIVKNQGVVMNARYNLADAILLALENVTGTAMLVDIDAVVETDGDPQRLLDLFMNKGYALPSLQCLDHLHPQLRQAQMETQLAKRISWVNEGHTVTIQDAARRLKERLLGHLIGQAGDVTESEQMVLNRNTLHPGLTTADMPHATTPLPEYVRKTALDLFETNLLHGCALIAQYLDVAAGMNLTDEQVEQLTKNLKVKYTGPAWPKCYDRTMLVEGAGDVYDQALMLAICSSAAMTNGLQLLQSNGYTISCALRYMENPVCRASVMHLLNGPKPQPANFNF